MTEQEAFEKWWDSLPEGTRERLVKGISHKAWQARGAYEGERTKKLVEAAQAILAYVKREPEIMDCSDCHEEIRPFIDKLQQELEAL